MDEFYKTNRDQSDRHFEFIIIILLNFEMWAISAVAKESDSTWRRKESVLWRADSSLIFSKVINKGSEKRRAF